VQATSLAAVGDRARFRSALSDASARLPSVFSRALAAPSGEKCRKVRDESLAANAEFSLAAQSAAIAENEAHTRVAATMRRLSQAKNPLIGIPFYDLDQKKKFR
jgi:hypothetical protein